MEKQTDNKNLPTVKILISYHKPAVLLKDEVLTPIHVGRALATESSKDGSMSEEDYKWMLENMIGDDTGDNISHLNREFCELTSMYWAWKNYDKLGNPDYIGFMHYRRHLIVNKMLMYRANTTIYYDYIDNSYKNNYLINQSNIQSILNNYDIIMSENITHTKNVYNQFKDLIDIPYTLNPNIFYKTIDYIKYKYIDYDKALQKYLNSKEHYWYNCFIVKKDIFFEYCNFLFDILFNILKNIDLSKETVNGQRVLAYISERIYGIFITKLLQDKNIKIKKLPLSYIKDTELIKDLYPKNNNSISICFSSDNNYAPYLAVAIKSLIENSNKNNYYEIYIIEENISDLNKNKIKKLTEDNNNIYIQFIDINAYINNVDKDIFVINSHFTISTYYRFFIPRIFKNFNKILYLDADILILHDLAELYNTDTDKMISACYDIEMIRCIFSEKYKPAFWTDYLHNKLELKNPYNYFQAGVLLLNIKKMIEYNFEEKCIKRLKEIQNPIYVDQCILNSIYGDNTSYYTDNINFLDLSWNLEWTMFIYYKDIISRIPINEYANFLQAYNNPKIIHYCGVEKPWQYPYYEKADIWFKYARMTDFYEEIIYNNIWNNIWNNINYNIPNNRFSIADFILSFVNNENELSIMFFGIKIRIKKNFLQENYIYYNKKDRIFSIYKNNRYTRITILGIKITIKK